MKIRVAVFSEISPLRDYIYTCEVPKNQTPDDVIAIINSQLKNAHCELITVIKENKRS